VTSAEPAPVTTQKPIAKTVPAQPIEAPKSAPKPAEVQQPVTQTEKPGKKVEFDFSSIDPEKEWECFGTFDGKHTECQECPFAKKCEEKKNAKK
jgi:hypothetical protein